MNVSSFRYSGLVHTKAVGVTPSVDKKGVIFVYKKAKKAVSICERFYKEYHLVFHDESLVLLDHDDQQCPLPKSDIT